MTHESLMSGVVILLSKKTWLRLGGFADGFLGVDNAFTSRLATKVFAST